LDYPDQELTSLIEYLQTSQIEIYAQQAISFTLEDSFIATVQRAEAK
jgi:ABC-2 type transport system ATP-binding protein